MTPNPSLSTCKSTFCLFWKNMLISSFRNRKSSLFQETVKFVTFFEKFLLKFPLWETVSQISSSLINWFPVGTVFLTDESSQMNTKRQVDDLLWWIYMYLPSICFTFQKSEIHEMIYMRWFTMILLANWVVEARGINCAEAMNLA